MPHKKPLIINKPSLHLESTLAPSKKPPIHSCPSSMPHKNPPTIDKPPSHSKSTMAPAQRPPTHSHPSLTRTQPTKSPATPSYMIVDSLLPFHIFLDPNMFQTYTPGCKTHTTPYGNTLVIKGTGTVIVHLAAEGCLFNVSLDECWHVPASSNNFYSCLHCQHEYVIHLGFTGLVQKRDGLFQLFIGIQIAKIGLDLIPLIFKYKGSRAIRYKI